MMTPPRPGLLGNANGFTQGQSAPSRSVHSALLPPEAPIASQLQQQQQQLRPLAYQPTVPLQQQQQLTDSQGHQRIHRNVSPAQRPRAPEQHQQHQQAEVDEHAVTGPSLATASAALENAEEHRTLRQAKIAWSISSQMCHSGHAEPSCGRRPPSKSSCWWEQEPHATSPATMQTMHAVVNTLQQQPTRPLPVALVGRILADAAVALATSKAAAVQHIRPKKPARLVVVGDTHGQLEDVLWIFHKHGLPSRSVTYLFNGDVADRGQHALEIFVLVLGFMAVAPEIMHMNRGSHEDEMMNHGPVGGFYDECLTKYGRDMGGKVFEQMRRIYALLPIATVISQTVFVVHGGLSRCNHFLSLLESLHDRQSTIPQDPHDAREQALVDALWSDPSEVAGFSLSSRGSNIVCFGPDVTQRFLRETGFSLIVRSHEVPQNLDGVFSMHGNRLLTVFSASNYCGDTGNQGAVLVFYEENGQLSYDISRHFAPSITSGVFKASSETEVGTAQHEEAVSQEEVAAVRKAMQRDPTNTRLHNDVLGQVARLVVEHKAALWAFFFRHDSQKSGFVDVDIWLQGCRATVGDFPWPMLRKLLVVEEQGSSGQVDYFAFLERFRVRLSGDEVSSEWTEQLLTRIYGRLLQQDSALREIMNTFDRDGNGTITVSELQDAFAELNVGVTMRQAASLMRTISSHASSTCRAGQPGGSIDAASFLSRFEMVYQPLAGQRELPHWVMTTLKRLGRYVWAGNAAGSTEDIGTPQEQVQRFFEVADANGDGSLSHAEFAAAVQRLVRQAGSSLQLHTLSEPELYEVAQWIDMTNAGSINYREFLASFAPSDVVAGNAFHVDLLEHICTVIWSNKPSLLSACLRLDERHSGEITRAHLAELLRALNFSLDHNNPPLTDEQILLLVDHTRFDTVTGVVRYQHFLDSFQVFDTASKPRF